VEAKKRPQDRNEGEGTTRTESRDPPRHPVRVASERTGLSPHLLRMWERRYGVVEPERSEGGQRLYTDAEVERLRLLHRATMGGRSIGQVADLPDESLVELIREDERGRARAPREPDPDVEDLLEPAIGATEALDEQKLERILRRSASTLGLPRFLEEVGVPLLRELGERWHAGDAGPAEEHMASAVLRRVVELGMVTLGQDPDAPLMVVATPAGERHEIGALLAAAATRAEGWRVLYLGADLPASEIAEAARRTGARIVGLSVAYANSSERMIREVDAVRERLPDHVTLLVGGAGAVAAADALAEVGAVPVEDLSSLRSALPDLEESGTG